jgi:hypothetical protein
MAQKENIFVALTSQYDGKAFARANKDMNGLDKLTNKLGKTLVGYFAASKLIDFGKSSVNAFTASQKSAQALNTTLKNTGSLLAFPDAMSGIKTLSQATGVADTELTNAFTTLYSATGNATKAQKDLALAVDVSKGTGNDLVTVVDAISAGYRGNTKALANLNAGLDTTTLATKDMDQITKQLATLQGGQAAAYAETYAGKIARIGVAVDDLKVSVGQGLVGALQALAGTTSIDSLSTSMHNLGLYLEAVIIRFGELAHTVLDSPIGAFFAASIDGWNKILGIQDKSLELQNEIWRQNTKALEQYYDQKAAQDKINEAYRKRLALQDKQNKATLDNAKKLQAAAKLLDRSGTILDVQQAEIYAALQGKITDNEKLRLDLQLALLTKNADAADQLSRQLFTSQLQTTDLAKTISSLPKALNPFADWPKYIQDLIAQMALLATAIPGAPTVTPTTTTQNPYDAMFEKLKQSNIAMGMDPGAAAGLAASSQRLQMEADAYFKLHPEIDPLTGAIRSGFAGSAQATGASYTFNIDANNTIDPNSITKAVQDAILIINRNGYSTVPAGQGF